MNGAFQKLEGTCPLAWHLTPPWVRPLILSPMPLARSNIPSVLRSLNPFGNRFSIARHLRWTIINPETFVKKLAIIMVHPVRRGRHGGRFHRKRYCNYLLHRKRWQRLNKVGRNWIIYHGSVVISIIQPPIQIPSNITIASWSETRTVSYVKIYMIQTTCNFMPLSAVCLIHRTKACIS